MGISKKGKRKLIYQGETYYWYVAPDPEMDGEYDSGSDFLHIMTEDKRVLLIYHINEMSSRSIRPMVRVFASDKLPQGGYCFWPPMADESITPGNVRKILDWYYEEIGKL